MGSPAGDKALFERYREVARIGRKATDRQIHEDAVQLDVRPMDLAVTIIRGLATLSDPGACDLCGAKLKTVPVRCGRCRAQAGA